MQQNIYMQSNEHFEVFTTVFSPQVSRGRHRYRQEAPEKMVVKHSYKPHWPDELELTQGDVIQVLFKHEESRWYGRLQTGQQGYFPATHVTELIEEDEPPKEGNVSIRRSSDGVVLTAGTHGSGGPPPTPGARRRLSLRCGDESPFHALRRESQHVAAAACHSPRLLQRILSKNRRKSESHKGASNGAFEPD
ncbi:jouberin-like [Alosa alosa]|uniref:jouberin-like n=1 Tax=Alosa alosa TaxID=278164 RepID=UPI0020153190|nr:jouberin-like [Alosa alosa]